MDEMDDWLREIFEAKKSAKEYPSENCIKGKEHEFEFFSHSDSKTHYTYHHRCKHCKEVIFEKIERTEEDKKLWN